MFENIRKSRTSKNMPRVSNTQLLETIHSLQSEMDDKFTSLDEKFTRLAEETHRLHTQLAMLQGTVESLSALSQEAQRTLRGSNGEAGLVAGVQSLRVQVQRLEQGQAASGVDEIARALHGTDKDPGLVERLRRLEELDRSIHKWVYLALSSLLVGALSLLFDLAPKLILLLSAR